MQEIYTVVILSVLRLNSSAKEVSFLEPLHNFPRASITATTAQLQSNVVIFYWMTACVVGIGLASWILVCSSKPALHYFHLKDESYNKDVCTNTCTSLGKDEAYNPL